MGVEAMAETAKILFPDLYIGAVEDVEFLAPFKFYRNQPRTVTVCAQFGVDGEDIVADCSLIGSRTLHGQPEPEITTHFKGRVRLVADKPKPVKDSAPKKDDSSKITASNVYSIYFHGPAYQVLDSAWKSDNDVIGMFAKTLPENHKPAEAPAAMSPRSLELCFQTVSLSSLVLQERLGLPYAFRGLQFSSRPDKGAGETFYAIVSANEDGTYDGRLADENGNVYMTLSGYRIMELPDPVQPNLLEPFKKAFDV